MDGNLNNQPQPTPEDVLTPQDSLEAPAQTGSVATNQPVQQYDQKTLAKIEAERLPGFLRNRLFYRVGIASGMVLLVTILLLGIAALYQKQHKVQLSQAQLVAQVKDQPVSLPATTSDQLASHLQTTDSTLYVNGNVSTQGSLSIGSTTGNAQLQPSSLSGTQTYILPNASGTLCLNSNNCGFVSQTQLSLLQQQLTSTNQSITGLQGSTSQSVASIQGVSGQLVVGGTTMVPLISLDSSVTSTLANSLVQGGNSFGASVSLGALDSNGLNLLAGGTTVASFSSTGQASLQNSTDSSSAFRVLNAAATPLFSVDTTNNQVSLGASSASPVVLQLGVGTGFTDPTGAAGQIYYNSALGEFRCYQGGTWTNCVAAGGGSGTGDINNGGNNFGSPITIGTKDPYNLSFLAANHSVATFSGSNGAAVFQNFGDSDSALQVQDAAGSSVLNLATSNGQLTLAGGITTKPQALWVPNILGSYASTPSAPANQITGDIDIQARIALNTWSNGSSLGVIGKSSNGLFGTSYSFLVGSGNTLYFSYSLDGSTIQVAMSSAPVSVADGGSLWLRVTRSASTGVVTFYTAPNSLNMPVTWTQLGTPQSTLIGALYNGPEDVEVGSLANGTSVAANNSLVYRARILNGIGGAPAVDFNPVDAGSAGQTSWSSVATGETWSLHGNARIVGDRSSLAGLVGIGNSGLTDNLLSVGTPTTADASAQVLVATNGSTSKGLVIQTAPGQVADAQQLQNSNGIVLSGVNANGGRYSYGASTTLSGLNPPSQFCYFLQCSAQMSTTGGSLAVGTYYYVVTSVNAAGESMASNMFSGTATSNTSTATIYINTQPPNMVPGATSFNIYRSNSTHFGGSNFLVNVQANKSGIVTYTDTGLPTSTGTPPTSTVGTGLVLQGWSGQTAGVLQVQNSAGASLAALTATGQLQVTGGASVGLLPAAVKLPTLGTSQVTTPSSGYNQQVSNLDVRVRLSLSSWSPGGFSSPMILMSKSDDIAADSSFKFFISGTGRLALNLSTGSSINGYYSTVGNGLSPGTTNWVRAARTDSTGAINFYTSNDGVNWTQLGTTVTGFTGSLHSSALPLIVGGPGIKGQQQTIYMAQLYGGSSLLQQLKPSDANSLSATSWVSSATGEVWSLEDSAQLIPATSQIMVSPGNTANIGLVVQSVAGQQADLQQNQDSSGSVISGVNATGSLFSNGINNVFGGLAQPTITNITVSPTGGTLAAGSYYYAVTAVSANGVETALSTVQANGDATTSGSTSSVTLTWTRVAGAVSYKIYRSPADFWGSGKFVASSYLVTVGGGMASYTDTGGAVTAGRPSTTTTGSPALTLQGWSDQTGNLLQIQNSSGTNLTTVNANGSLQVTGGATLASLSPLGIKLDGLLNNFSISTPNAPANQITGDMSMIVWASLNHWSGTNTSQTLISKLDGNPADGGWALIVTPGGNLALTLTQGGTYYAMVSTAPVSLADGAATHVYVNRTASTGAINFYTSGPGAGITWTQVGSTVIGPTGALDAGNQAVQVGSFVGGNLPMVGTVYRASLYNDASRSSMVLDMLPADAGSLVATSWTGDLTGETWTLTGTAAMIGAKSQISVSSNDSATAGITIQGANGQVAALLQAVDYSGDRLFSVDYRGGIHATGDNNGFGGIASIANATVGVYTTAGTHVGITVRGASGQSANLQEWQDVNSTVLASVSGAGVGSFANLLQNGSQVCDASNNCNFLTKGAGSYNLNGVAYYDGTNLVTTSAGTSGQCLLGSVGAPIWGACSGGGGGGSGDINQGGNSLGANVSIGANDNFGVNLLTNGTAVAKFSNTGQATLQNSTDSATALQIQNASGVSLFTVDSTNSVIYIGNPTPDGTATLLVLDSKNTSGDPTGINGAMYYNSASQKFRCYQGSVWQDCVNNSQLAGLSADQSTTSTSLTNVNGLSFGVIASNNYRLTCSLLMSLPVSSGATSNGVYLSMSASGTGGSFTSSFFKTFDQGSGDNYAVSNTLNDPAPSSISRITNQTGNRFLLTYNATLTGVASNGTWQLEMRSADGSNVTINQGSSCTLQPLL